MRTIKFTFLLILTLSKTLFGAETTRYDIDQDYLLPEVCSTFNNKIKNCGTGFSLRLKEDKKNCALESKNCYSTIITSAHQFSGVDNLICFGTKQCLSVDKKDILLDPMNDLAVFKVKHPPKSGFNALFNLVENDENFTLVSDFNYGQMSKDQSKIESVQWRNQTLFKKAVVVSNKNRNDSASFFETSSTAISPYVPIREGLTPIAQSTQLIETENQGTDRLKLKELYFSKRLISHAKLDNGVSGSPIIGESETDSIMGVFSQFHSRMSQSTFQNNDQLKDLISKFKAGERGTLEDPLFGKVAYEYDEHIGTTVKTYRDGEIKENAYNYGQRPVNNEPTDTLISNDFCSPLSVDSVDGGGDSVDGGGDSVDGGGDSVDGGGDSVDGGGDSVDGGGDSVDGGGDSVDGGGDSVDGGGDSVDGGGDSVDGGGDSVDGANESFRCKPDNKQLQRNRFLKYMNELPGILYENKHILGFKIQKEKKEVDIYANREALFALKEFQKDKDVTITPIEFSSINFISLFKKKFTNSKNKHLNKTICHGHFCTKLYFSTPFKKLNLEFTYQNRKLDTLSINERGRIKSHKQGKETASFQPWFSFKDRDAIIQLDLRNLFLTDLMNLYSDSHSDPFTAIKAQSKKSPVIFTTRKSCGEISSPPIKIEF